ncbi:MAG: ATP-binding protein [Gemmatimonadota bacterium]|nr:ATP-binding protein [Gemmatimonadota bacterium]
MSFTSIASRIPGFRLVPDALVMSETNRWVATARGPLAVLTLIFFLETLSRAGLLVPQVELFLLLVVAYVAFVDGILPGLIGSALAVAYYAYANSPAGEIFHTSVYEWEQLVIAGTSIPALALLIGLLRRELESATVREHEVRERLSTVVEHLSAAFVTIGEEGRVGYVNARALELLGVSDLSAVGHRFWARVEDVLGTSAMERIERAVREGRSDDFEERVGEDGPWYGIQIHPIPGGAALYVADVTERKRLQEQMTSFRRSRAIGQFASGIAHDFNNLLTAIKGYNEIALSEAAPDDPIRSSLEEVDKASKRASRLTRQLLAFSRQQVRQPETLDLNDVVRDMEPMFRRLVREDVRIDVSLDSDGVPARVDIGQVEQVLVNLVANASDAMPDGGRLEIETSRTEVSEPIERGKYTIPPGSYVELSVRDSGVGMDAETRAKIFEPFFTTKHRGGGTGLGLATVYGIVKQNEGYVLVESSPGAGSTFRVWLPASEEEVEPAAEPAIEAPREEPAEREGATILLVEDEPAIRRLAARILSSDGHVVIEAGDGAEALEVAERHDGEIDLLFTDIVMPKASGRKVARTLTDRWPHLAVVYTSGYTNEQNLGAGIERGILEPDIHFVHKPFTPDELTERIDAALQE